MLSAIESEAQRKDQGNVINNYYTASDGGIIVGRDLSGNLISCNNTVSIEGLIKAAENLNKLRTPVISLSR